MDPNRSLALRSRSVIVVGNPLRAERREDVIGGGVIIVDGKEGEWSELVAPFLLLSFRIRHRRRHVVGKDCGATWRFGGKTTKSLKEQKINHKSMTTMYNISPL